MNRKQATYSLAILLFVLGVIWVHDLVNTPTFGPLPEHTVVEHTAPAATATHTHTNTTVLPDTAPDPVATGTAVQINGVNYIPCPTEDYDGPTPCFWDSGARGNGTGHSFVWDGRVVLDIVE